MADPDLTVYAVLLAGGSGTRLWPVSRQLYPKQLVKLIGNESLVQRTIKRLPSTVDPANIMIVCGKEHMSEIQRHMGAVGVDSKGRVIGEPCGRNTAPAILLAVMEVFRRHGDGIICVFPADHVIRDIQGFHDKLSSAVRLAGQGHIVTFGITPDYPETGYGYIEGDAAVGGGAFCIKRFVEKPDRDTAVRYLNAGNYFWNSGMFVFKASVMIDEFKSRKPELHERMTAIVASGEVTREAYEQLENVSIDVAVMEQTAKGVVLPSDFGWSDIGSWKSLYDFLPKDPEGNVMDGDVIAGDTRNSFIMGYQRLIAVNHVENLVVIETPDSVFVSDIENSRDVKHIVEQLKQKGRAEYFTHRTVCHAWGSETVLEEKSAYRVDRIELYPNSELRIPTETDAMIRLVVLSGRAQMFKYDAEPRMLEMGESVAAIASDLSKIRNPGTDSAVMLRIRMENIL